MPIQSFISRKKFLQSASIISSSILLAKPFKAFAFEEKKQGITVGQVMDFFIKEVPGAPFTSTVDTLKSGNRETPVTGIVTTMFATIDVIKKAVALKANFIIAHEPTFYNHQDQTQWLEDDEVYKFKSALLNENKIAVWRNHDYVHSLQVDGVRKQVAEQLGWEKFGKPGQPVYNLSPAPTLKDLIESSKKKFGVPAVRYIGDLSQSCGKVLLMPGAAGGMSQIRAIRNHKPDVLICGEVSEWETAEYVRDARAKGDKLALIVIGHVASEEPGSVFMEKWLKQRLPQLKTTHLPAGNSLSFL